MSFSQRHVPIRFFAGVAGLAVAAALGLALALYPHTGANCVHLAVADLLLAVASVVVMVRSRHRPWRRAELVRPTAPAVPLQSAHHPVPERSAAGSLQRWL